MVAPFYASRSGSTLTVADYQAAGEVGAADLTTVASPLSRVVTDELDETCRALGLEPDELLLAALGGAIGRVVGEGVVGVDVSRRDGTACPVMLRCENDHGDRATETLVAVHRAVVTASLLGAAGAGSVAEIAFSFRDNAASDGAMAAGRALEVVAYPLDGLVELDWRYDARRFDPYTIEELAEQFPLALIALTSEAVPPIDGVVTTQSRIFAAQ